ncbi:MAG: hypothetical protein K2K19_04720 [Acetatifactor sp.]|nr:hypothetical protein [Acetatifactor sp.]
MKRDNKIFCTKCGKELKPQEDMIREGYFSADVIFGYFSNKDGLRHRWDLCESCYDALTASFQIPVEENEESELV